MPAEQDKAVVRRFVEVMNGGNLDGGGRAHHSGSRQPRSDGPDVPPGPEGVKQVIGMYRFAFPDIPFHTGEMFAVDGRVAHRWTFTGTYEGEMMGVAPTGRRVEVSGVEINHVETGRISESWTVSDALGLMQQLGLTPQPEDSS